MIEVYPNLFVGSAEDLIYVDDGNKGIKDGWLVISAAKFPFHRDAVGYKQAAAPKDSPEYLYAVRPSRLILNLIDAPDPAYVPDEIVTMTMQTINMGLNGGKVLIHCNQGQSRAPTLALLWMHGLAPSLAETEYGPPSYDEAVKQFLTVYPTFAPSKGLEGYARAHWDKPAL